MALRTVTGSAWDAGRNPIPPELQPELFFRPEPSPDAPPDFLLVAVEKQATLSASGGITVQLEALPGLLYRPVIRWLVNPANSDPELRAYGYFEWPRLINPYPNGGDIADLTDVDLSVHTVLVQLAPPPAGYRGWYLNAPGAGQPVGDPDDPASSGTGILERIS